MLSASTAKPAIQPLASNPKKLTVGLVGAGGKIGTKVLETIWGNSEQFQNVGKVVALNTLPRTNFGMFLDFSVAYSDKMFNGAKLAATATELTSDPAKLKDMDVIIVSAGLWPDEATRKEWDKKDNTGRLVQSSVNFPLVKKICGDIAKFAPKAIVYVITNQVDMMTELARKELPQHTIIGIGGYIDTMRYKFVLANLLAAAGIIDTPNPNRISAHIIGYHNNDMLLLKDSLLIDGKIPDWNNPDVSFAVDQAIEGTRAFGKEVSNLQSHPKKPGIDAGSSIAPAKAITDIIQAMSSAKPLIASFNIRLDETTAKQYGVPVNTGLSVPVAIQGMDIKPVVFKPSNTEKEKLISAQQKLNKDMQNLFALQVGQPSLPVTGISNTVTVNEPHTYYALLSK